MAYVPKKEEFQSQMRSRSTCDNALCFFLKFLSVVSISDEKPLHMRHGHAQHVKGGASKFQSQMRSRSTCDDISTHNGHPLSMFQSQMRSRSTCDVNPPLRDTHLSMFQSQMRSRSTCDIVAVFGVCSYASFQSQMRSRSTCDCGSDDAYIAEHRVSISDEKPLHMRRTEETRFSLLSICLNIR